MSRFARQGACPSFTHGGVIRPNDIMCVSLLAYHCRCEELVCWWDGFLKVEIHHHIAEVMRV